VGADTFLILTDVEGLYERFGEPDQRLLDRLTPADARARVESGELPPGSMGPKVAAAAGFVEAGGERSIIAELDRAPEALGGAAGTVIAG